MNTMCGSKRKVSEVTTGSWSWEEELGKLHRAERDELQKAHIGERSVLMKFHSQAILPNQCSSTLIRIINAPVDTVWGILSRFEQPQIFSNLVKSCSLLEGDGSPGSVRELTLVSGLPMTKTTERLELFDKETHVCRIRGNARGEEESASKRDLNNYLSVLSIHERVIDGQRKTLAIQSYVSEVPEGSTAAETCTVLNTLLNCTLKSLAERAATQKSGLYTVKSCQF